MKGKSQIILKKRLSDSNHRFMYQNLSSIKQHCQSMKKKTTKVQSNKKYDEFRKKYPHLGNKYLTRASTQASEAQSYECKSSFCCDIKSQTVKQIEQYYSIGKMFFKLPKIVQKQIQNTNCTDNYKKFQKRKYSLLGLQKQEIVQKRAKQKIQEMYLMQKNRIYQKMEKLSIVKARLKLLDKIQTDKQKLIAKIRD